MILLAAMAIIDSSIYLSGGEWNQRVQMVRAFMIGAALEDLVYADWFKIVQPC